MPFSLYLWFKVVTLTFFGVLNLLLLFYSMRVDYQYELAREHTRFRKGMPTQAEWLNAPKGKLKSYLFNVTNADAFLSGKDTKMKLQEVGPIVYKIRGNNDVLHQNETTLTFRRYRYRTVEFLPDESVAPDILNQTITLPNLVLLGSAAKFHDWSIFVRHAFNAITINEKIFLKQSIYFFLWEFTTPGLSMLSKYMPNIASNCGMLYNALQAKEEIFNVKIGPENGVENFFRVNTLNDKIYFKEQYSKLRYLRPDSKVLCPIDVRDGLDNSLYPPFLKPDTPIRIVASEMCRTLPIRYQRTIKHNGLSLFRYSVAEYSETPSCLDTTYGTKLHKGFFDSTACMINDAPTAFSNPHFLDTSYNWTEHFEGLSPSTEKHEPHIILEPITGIPIIEKYRFQSNIPMPTLSGYDTAVGKFSNIVIPTFWYEFDMDELPAIVLFVIRFNVEFTPILQPILMVSFLLISTLCALKIYLLFREQTISDFLSTFSGSSNMKLETTFPLGVTQDVTELEAPVKK